MKYFVPTGPARTLQCVGEKFSVDFAQGIGAIRQPWHSQQSKLCYENLHALHVTPEARALCAVTAEFISDLEKSLSLLGQIMTELEPDYLAMVSIGERLEQLKNASIGMPHGYLDGGLQLDKLQRQIAYQQKKIENSIVGSDLIEFGRIQYELVLARWNNREFMPFSPAGRCYATLQDLYWGAFGRAIYFCNRAQKTRLLDELGERLIYKLAREVNASPYTRHYYHDWLATPPLPGVVEYKEVLAWLGDASDIDGQPISYSITQTWRGISLGMPRICSAQRMASALLDEVFS